MIKQVFYFNVDIIKYHNLTVSIPVCLLILIIIIGLILRDKNVVFKRLMQLSYLLIIIGLSRVFIFDNSNEPLINNDLSFLNYYLYSLFNNFRASMVIFSIMYAHFNIIVFLVFRVIFEKIRTFFYVMLSLNVLILILNMLNLNNHSISLTTLILNLGGYLIGLFVYYIFSSD